MSNVVKLHPSTDIPQGLRNIAASIERGEVDGESCTIIIGLNVYNLGSADDGKAAANAIFDMTYGVQRLMQPVVDMASVDD
jgi:hypothetical protein